MPPYRTIPSNEEPKINYARGYGLKEKIGIRKKNDLSRSGKF
jgi:hypothetical protein